MGKINHPSPDPQETKPGHIADIPLSLIYEQTTEALADQGIKPIIAAPTIEGGLVGNPPLPVELHQDLVGTVSHASVQVDQAATADQPMARTHDRPETPVFPPRGLVMAWCLWLLGSWMLVIRHDASAAASRWIVFAALVGMMLLWPVWRLSQAGFVESRVSAKRVGAPAVWILMDWISMGLVFQMVLWPIRLNTRWSLEQIAWLDGALGAWSLLTGLIVVWGCASEAWGRRTMAMGMCVLLMLGEPLAMALLNAAMAGDSAIVWTMYASPIATIWGLTGPSEQWTPAPWSGRVIVAAIAAVMGWILILTFSAAAYRGKNRQPTSDSSTDTA